MQVKIFRSQSPSEEHLEKMVNDWLRGGNVIIAHALQSESHSGGPHAEWNVTLTIFYETEL